MNRHSENELLNGLKAGNPEAYDQLVDQSGPVIFRLALHLTGNRADAEDLVQDVFMKCIRFIDTFSGDSRIQTWLYQVAVNEFLASKRSKISQVIQPAEKAGMEDDFPDSQPSPDSETDANLVQARLRKALDLLSPGQRTVFVLRHYHEMSLDEIARITGLQTGTVKSHLHRALTNLRQQLKPYHPEYKNA